MLAIAVSLTFALSAMIALGVIALTLHQQAPSVMAVIAQARAARVEEECLSGSAPAAAFAPMARPRRIATATPLPGARRSAVSPLVARPSFAGPRCAAA